MSIIIIKYVCVSACTCAQYVCVCVGGGGGGGETNLNLTCRKNPMGQCVTHKSLKHITLMNFLYLTTETENNPIAWCKRSIKHPCKTFKAFDHTKRNASQPCQWWDHQHVIYIPQRSTGIIALYHTQFSSHSIADHNIIKYHHIYWQWLWDLMLKRNDFQDRHITGFWR